MTNLHSEHFRKHKGIKRQHQLIALGKFICEEEPNRNELNWFALAFRGHTLNRMKTGFEIFVT